MIAIAWILLAITIALVIWNIVDRLYWNTANKYIHEGKMRPTDVGAKNHFELAATMINWRKKIKTRETLMLITGATALIISIILLRYK